MRTIHFVRSSSFIVGALFTGFLTLGLIAINHFLEQIASLSGFNPEQMAQIKALVSNHANMMIAIMLAIVLLSFLVAFYVVNRINRMSDTITRIMNTGNLGERLHIDSSWDDLSKLSEVINRMLAALEEMVAGVKSVSDNVAHDLRTPLTRLRGHLEMSESPDKHAFIAEVDHILSIFNGLLRIADIETERQKSAFQQNQLAPITADVVELYEALADAKNITLITDIRHCQMFSDKHLLFQTFANILDNAIKFTPEGGQIKLTLSSEYRRILFTVCDSGPGIEEQHLEQITKRFYRVDSSRTTAGNGLGLALVNAVVNLHGGKVNFYNSKQDNGDKSGLCCELELPN